MDLGTKNLDLKSTVTLPIWKTYLYQLQLQAPSPKVIPCQRHLPNKPPHYGLEFHGMISRQEAERLLGDEDGNFLVRESNNPPNSCTLAIKFNHETKNYKMYYDGAFYVGEKRFDSVVDLVHDGLISFYIEKHASNYIAMMAEENNYSESPYVASRTALLARQKVTTPGSEPVQAPQNSQKISPSIHSAFQKQHGVPSQQHQQQAGANHPQIPSTNGSLSQFHHMSSSQQTNQHQLLHQQQQQQMFFLDSNQQQSNTINSTANQVDKENRHRQFTSLDFANSQQNGNGHSNTISNANTINGNENGSSLISSNSKSLLPVNKSNAIFDRFHIMNSEKPHCFKSQNFKGPHWCDFCMNFMWGLVSQGVKCSDCGFQAHKKCSERTPPDCEPQMKFIKRIFGVDLTTLVKATGSIRPVILEKCIEEIERRRGAIESEGLYRVSGFSDAIEELKLAFDRGDNVDFNEFRYNDIHIICSLLKLYLRQLPIPLITFEVYNRLIEVLNTSSHKPNLIELIRQCIIELPPAHYLTLKYLIEHLVKVTRFSTKNQMNHENLAIVFGPTLMRSINPDPILALKNTHKEQKVAELLILNYSSIFDK